MSDRIISLDRSIIVSPDVGPERFRSVVHATGDILGVSAQKIGSEIGLGLRLDHAVEIVHGVGQAAIYDHQKGGTDTPDSAESFARTMVRGGVDATIIFPFTGPTVETRWIKALQDAHVPVIVGADMTHEDIGVKKGGFIRDNAFEEMYCIAAEQGVRDFVVPGNKPDKIARYRRLFDREIGEGEYTLYSPGLIAQGGELTAAGEAAGPRWHAIIGRGICNAADVRQAATQYAQQLIV